MQVVEQSWEFVNPLFKNLDDYKRMIDILTVPARVCYQAGIYASPEQMLQTKIIDSGHHSVIEHCVVTVIATTNRGVTHEAVRHRIASYSQESTRYCNYSKDRFDGEIKIIDPVWAPEPFVLKGQELTLEQRAYCIFLETCQHCEHGYMKLLELGWTAQQAREVLPNALKTQIVITYNLREWRHFFSLRADLTAHPQMRALASSMLVRFKEVMPLFFSDLQ